MGWGQGEEMNQALYAYMNNKRKKKESGNQNYSEILSHLHYNGYCMSLVSLV
jgi:hypothetical protein